MIKRLLPVAAAVAAAALVPTLVVYAKDDPAKIAADREALRKDYLSKKKYPFQDLNYFVDYTKLKDSRWEISTKLDPEPDPDQGTMFVANFPSGSPTDASASIKVYVRKCICKDSAKNTKYIHEFKAWGKTVDLSDTKTMVEGYYWDWTLSATDVIKEKSKIPDKKNVGPAEYWGCAVGTDKEDKKRVKKDWYIWVENDRRGAWHWVVHAETADKFIDVKERAEALDDLVRNIAEMKDPRAHLK